jgi:hypothetical protein
MQTKARLSSYEEVEFSITLTAPVSDWRTMLKKLEDLNRPNVHYAWPVGGLVGCIRSMLDNLDKTHADAVRKEDQSSPQESEQ